MGLFGYVLSMMCVFCLMKMLVRFFLVIVVVIVMVDRFVIVISGVLMLF